MLILFRRGGKSFPKVKNKHRWGTRGLVFFRATPSEGQAKRKRQNVRENMEKTKWRSAETKKSQQQQQQQRHQQRSYKCAEMANADGGVAKKIDIFPLFTLPFPPSTHTHIPDILPFRNSKEKKTRNFYLNLPLVGALFVLCLTTATNFLYLFDIYLNFRENKHHVVFFWRRPLAVKSRLVPDAASRIWVSSDEKNVVRLGWMYFFLLLSDIFFCWYVFEIKISLKLRISSIWS